MAKYEALMEFSERYLEQVFVPKSVWLGVQRLGRMLSVTAAGVVKSNVEEWSIMGGIS